MTLSQRFWKKVNKNGPVPDHTPELGPCWVWTASPHNYPHHYGTIKTSRHGCTCAHRVSWELHSGPIIGNLLVLHKCDNMKCVRPDHLFLGTQKDNMRDCQSKGRRNFQRDISTFSRGTGRHNSILTEQMVVSIRKTFSEGKSCHEIGRILGIDHRTIWKAVTRRTWAHIQ